MKKYFFIQLLLSTIVTTVFAQVVGIGTNTPDTSSVLELSSTNKAFLPPRMTTIQRNQIANPVAGMVIFNTDSTCVEIYRGASWFNLCSVSHPLFNGTVVQYAPSAVVKSQSQRVFVHLMPWFETPTTNTLSPGKWGLHWTMANENPNTVLPNGQRQIASNYYPLTGPYASNDTTIIDYQLLLMKLSGVDGVLIDWPGTGTNNGANSDLPMSAANTKAFIARVGMAGLKYALVYEDNDLSSVSNKIAGAQTDLLYAQTNYFTDPNYQQYNNKPLLLDFGPQQITTGANWGSVFSALTATPSFLTLWHQSSEASGEAIGEFAWINANNTTSLNSFYANSYNPGVKIGAAYPGFNTFYQQGGWGGPTFVITANGTTNFTTTLNLALQSGNQYIQIPTWNDYGEGTMIEPTDSTTGGFGYSLLTTLQTQLGVVGLSQADLEAVFKLYQLRQTYVGNTAKLAALNQVYYYMVSLQMDKAKALLATL